MTCDRCGHVIAIGEWPFCDHGVAASSVVGDEIPGGQWQENGLPVPQKFYSKAERVKALAQYGNEIAPHWVPNDKHLTNWANGMDAKTLENAAVLVSRGTRVKTETEIKARLEWER